MFSSVFPVKYVIFDDVLWFGSAVLLYLVRFGSGAMPKAHFKVRFFFGSALALKRTLIIGDPPLRHGSCKKGRNAEGTFSTTIFCGSAPALK